MSISSTASSAMVAMNAGPAASADRRLSNSVDQQVRMELSSEIWYGATSG